MTAGATRDHRHIGMELGRRPTGVALMACRAVGARRNVIGGLAGGTAAVVTAGADGGRRECAVIGLGAGPDGGGFVAGLASRRGCNVAAGLASRCRTVMTAGATRDHRHIGVELGRRPTGVALMASRAVGAG